MNRIADITIKSLMSSGFAIGLAVACLFSTAAKAEQWSYDAATSGIDSFSNNSATTLMKVELAASTSVWNNNSLNVSASYKTISFNKQSNALGYSELSKDFNVSAPIGALDFSESIRERSEICLEKIIDKLIIDGAVGFNLSW